MPISQTRAGRWRLRQGNLTVPLQRGRTEAEARALLRHWQPVAYLAGKLGLEQVMRDAADDLFCLQGDPEGFARYCYQLECRIRAISLRGTIFEAACLTLPHQMRSRVA